MIDSAGFVPVSTQIDWNVRHAQWVPLVAPAIVLSGSTLAVTEGSRSMYDVRLSGPPSGTVMVSVSSSDSAAPASLTYRATG